MDRRQELINIVCKDNLDNEASARQLVDEIAFLESRLIELKKLPFISVNPKNASQQRSTAASKQYKELLQQYINCIKVLFAMTGQDTGDIESPLRKWAQERLDNAD